MRRALWLAGAVCGALALGGCASVPAGAPQQQGAAVAAPAAHPADPWESWNRKVYAFNDALDTHVVRPVAEAYQAVVPQLVRTGIGNVFGNVSDLWSAANHLLQGKLQDGVEMGMRVIVNTSFGLGGLLDPATEMRLTRRSEDFGQTLGVWGVGAGPYVVLPLLGPSTLRDTAALPLDRVVSASTLPATEAGRYTLTALELINTRTNLLATTGLMDQVALDRYSFLREAYLARRLDQVFDGAPPLENFDDEFADEPPPAPPAPPAAGTKPQ
ncbi:MlaA family lipoprotein [Rubrivivax sp. RP6-9]|uniref:MlaA family lipoprotein n=1 Tax=Rubrivivax sp. RP6-9 TaxID=3415750 RepID=UPI003CC6C7A4